MATKILGTARSGDAIYVISDAGDNSSHIHERRIEDLLLQSRIRLFVFLLAEPSPLQGIDSGSQSMMDIARVTGGFVFGISGRNSVVEFLPSSSYAFDYNERTRQLIKAYTRALNIQVNGFYTLRFDLPTPPEKTHKLSLEVVDGGGKRRNDVAYTYSTGLPFQAK